MMQGLVARWQKCMSQAKDTIDVSQTDAAMATMMLGQTDDGFKAVDADLENMSITTTEAANAVRAGLYANAEGTKTLIIIGTAIGFVISAIVSLLVGASIVGPIKSITGVMQQLSAGKTRGQPDRSDHRPHPGDRAADQPAGAQRDHRGGARRRRRQGLRRGRGGGEIAGAADRESDRGDQPQDRRGERLVRRGRRHHGAGGRRHRPARRRHRRDGERRSASRRPRRRKSPRTRSRPPTARASSRSNIVELDNKTRENDDASGQALDGAKRLLDHAALLQRQVDNFLRHVRAA